MPLHRDPVRQLSDLLAERLQQFLAELGGNRTARFEKRAVLAFEQFHPEPLGRHREHHVFLDFLQRGRALDGLLKLVFQLVHVVFMDGKAFAPGASQSVSDVFPMPGRIAEIATHGLLDLFTAAQQPQHDKQRHHRGDKIGEGNLPRPAMVPAVALLPAFNDDDRLRALSQQLGRLRPAGAAPLPLQVASISLNVGRIS